MPMPTINDRKAIITNHSIIIPPIRQSFEEIRRYEKMERLWG